MLISPTSALCHVLAKQSLKFNGGQLLFGEFTVKVSFTAEKKSDDR